MKQDTHTSLDDSISDTTAKKRGRPRKESNPSNTSSRPVVKRKVKSRIEDAIASEVSSKEEIMINKEKEVNHALHLLEEQRATLDELKATLVTETADLIQQKADLQAQQEAFAEERRNVENYLNAREAALETMVQQASVRRTLLDQEQTESQLKSQELEDKASKLEAAIAVLAQKEEELKQRKLQLEQEEAALRVILLNTPPIANNFLDSAIARPLQVWGNPVRVVTNVNSEYSQVNITVEDTPPTLLTFYDISQGDLNLSDDVPDYVKDYLESFLRYLMENGCFSRTFSFALDVSSNFYSADDKVSEITYKFGKLCGRTELASVPVITVSTLLRGIKAIPDMDSERRMYTLKVVPSATAEIRDIRRYYFNPEQYSKLILPLKEFEGSSEGVDEVSLLEAHLTTAPAREALALNRVLSLKQETQNLVEETINSGNSLLEVVPVIWDDYIWFPYSLLSKVTPLVEFFKGEKISNGNPQIKGKNIKFWTNIKFNSLDDMMVSVPAILR